MERISIISSSPIVFVHRSEIYRKLITLLIDKLLYLNSTPFQFINRNNEVVEEKYRNTYAVNEIFNDRVILDKIKEFSINILPEFIKDFKKYIDEKDYKLKNKDNLRYCLRVRVFEDIEGYSLQPHKDSEDTIFSFILQLNNENLKTSTYRHGKYYKLNGFYDENSAILQKKILEAIKRICPNEKIYFGINQFRKNVGIWTDSKFFRYEVNDSLIMLQELDEHLIDIPEDSIYAICNSFEGAIFSNKLNLANKDTFHGVRPTFQKSRKLLIMDLIAQPTSKDVLVMQGVNNDKNSYFLIYSPEKCSELTDLLS